MNDLIPQRYPEMMSNDVRELYRLLDSTAVVHVSIVRDGRPFTFGTLAVRVEDSLVIHGSTGSRWMRELLHMPCAVAVTKVDGILVARSAFESSMLYRSALIFGQFLQVPDSRKDQVLKVLTDRIIPGRSSEVRASKKKELAATLLLEVPLKDWSLRISDDWPEDPVEDVSGDAWAGKILVDDIRSSLMPAPDLRPGIHPSPSVFKAQENLFTII